jgi:hypothetical protein
MVASLNSVARTDVGFASIRSVATLEQVRLRLRLRLRVASIRSVASLEQVRVRLRLRLRLRLCLDTQRCNPRAG